MATAEHRAAGVVSALVAAGSTVAAAESLTGGLVSAALTDVPGSSAVVRGGIVAYASDLKVALLGVPEQLVAVHGVVSQACAGAMAEGVRRVASSDYGLATTGVAGPSEQEGHPAGTVFVAVAGPNGTTARRLRLSGSRAAIREASVDAVLADLLDAVTRDGGIPPREHQVLR